MSPTCTLTDSDPGTRLLSVERSGCRKHCASRVKSGLYVLRPHRRALIIVHHRAPRAGRQAGLIHLCHDLGHVGLFRASWGMLRVE